MHVVRNDHLIIVQAKKKEHVLLILMLMDNVLVLNCKFCSAFQCGMYGSDKADDCSIKLNVLLIRIFYVPYSQGRNISLILRFGKLTAKILSFKYFDLHIRRYI